jgi:lactoylglutathione lyase
MKLGAFSVSLAVKDIHVSREFYSKLGFVDFGGDIDQNWIIMKNGDHLIGLFQGMFEENILTFNPGWDQNASDLESFTDVREIHKKLSENGAVPEPEVEFDESGPGSFSLKDPDGNTILIDQHR